MNQYKEEMKKFFESYYEKMKAVDEDCVSNPAVPEDMWEDNQPKETEWKVWKLIPATVTDEMLSALEKQIGMEFPEIFKAFLTTYFHMFSEGIGMHSSKAPFKGMKNAWNPMLVKAGFLPFAWDEEGYFIRCIKVGQGKSDLGVYQIDHEILFDFDEETVKNEDIEKEMRFVANDFKSYLQMLLEK